MNTRMPRHRGEEGLTLLETILALVILGLGMVVALNLFPIGVATSTRVENQTRARLLAEEILAGIKADPSRFPILPNPGSLGAVSVIALPGNAFDDDGDWDVTAHDVNQNRLADADFDAMPEPLFLQDDGLDNDHDGVIDDNGDGCVSNCSSLGSMNFISYLDGDLTYDPEPFIDEEFCDGRDNDGDGRTDEDCRLASLVVGGAPGRFGFYDPFGPGNAQDDDGDGELGSPEVQVLDFLGNPRLARLADGIDNNNNGVIDEGIDEEIYDGIDNDGDGVIDEDTKLATYPFYPQQLAMPNDRFFWQIAVGRVPDNGGNNIDDDFDGRTDEELLNGLDDDGDGSTDEDCRVAPLRGFRLVTVHIYWGGDLKDNDGDGRIDEERPDGVDDDGDGVGDDINGADPTLIDTWQFEYQMTGVVELRFKS